MTLKSEYKTEYNCWLDMMHRCTRAEHPSFKNYGARGITVSDPWKDFAVFLADMGKRPDNMSIDRINNDAGYSKENCRWATRTEQNRNQRPKVNLTGRKYGLLTVLRRVPLIIGKQKVFWVCLCECGNTRDVVTGHLQQRQTMTCGRPECKKKLNPDWPHAKMTGRP